MKLSRALQGNRFWASLARWRRALAHNVWDNPVTRKELRGRMRTGLAFITLSVYAASLSLFLVGFYAILVDANTFAPSTYSTEELGGSLFGAVVGLEMVLIGFTVPNLTAGAVSGERERQTYDLLRVTLLPAHTLILGKLTAALGYAGLLLVVAVPLQSVAFFFGGVNAVLIWLSLWMMALEALLLASVGLYFSSRSKRTFSAKALTYVALAFLVLGLPLAGGWVMTMRANAPAYQMPSVWVTLVVGVLVCFNPALALLLTYSLYTKSSSLFLFSYTAGNGPTLTLPSPWIVFSVLYLGLAAIFLGLAVRRVRRVEG